MEFRRSDALRTRDESTLVHLLWGVASVVVVRKMQRRSRRRRHPLFVVLLLLLLEWISTERCSSSHTLVSQMWPHLLASYACTLAVLPVRCDNVGFVLIGWKAMFHLMSQNDTASKCASCFALYILLTVTTLPLVIVLLAKNEWNDVVRASRNVAGQHTVICFNYIWNDVNFRWLQVGGMGSIPRSWYWHLTVKDMSVWS